MKVKIQIAYKSTMFSRLKTRQRYVDQYCESQQLIISNDILKQTQTAHIHHWETPDMTIYRHFAPI